MWGHEIQVYNIYWSTFVIWSVDMLGILEMYQYWCFLCHHKGKEKIIKFQVEWVGYQNHGIQVELFQGIKTTRWRMDFVILHLVAV